MLKIFFFSITSGSAKAISFIQVETFGFGRETANTFLDKFPFVLRKRQHLKLKYLSMFFSFRYLWNMDLKEQGALGFEKLSCLLQAVDYGGFMAKKIKGIVWDNNMIKFAAKCHFAHIHTDILYIRLLAEFCALQHRE